MNDVFVNKMISNGIAKATDVIGYTDFEVNEIESDLNVQLPITFKSFLKCMGKKAGKFLEGTNVFLQNYKDLKGLSVELLLENNEKFELSENDFVFLMHQGYEFMFFKIGESSDPAVYQYVEGDGEPELAWSSLSDFFSDSLNDYIIHRDLL